MIAENGESWRDFAEFFKEATEASEFVRAVNFRETVDDVARNEDVFWLLFVRVFDDGVELFIFDDVAKVNVAKDEDIERDFAELVVKAIAGFVESSHGYQYSIKAVSMAGRRLCMHI